MKNTILIILLYSILISCSQTKNINNSSNFSATEYWSRVPDLSKVTYEGGDGKTVESPIQIKNAENERNGVAAEYSYIEKLYGEKMKDWKLIGHSTLNKNNKQIDFIKILFIHKNETISFYFDISDFYGKFK